VATAMLLPFSPVAHYLGFVPLPPSFFVLLAGLIASYLVLVEGCKRWFYQRIASSEFSK
jgi:Mg2+-importing ATPase